MYQILENRLCIIDLAFIKSSKVSNKGTTLNLFFIFASFCKNKTDKISDAEVVIEITYAPKHSEGSSARVLKVDQTSLFSRFENLNLLIIFFFVFIFDLRKFIFSSSVKLL